MRVQWINMKWNAMYNYVLIIFVSFCILRTTFKKPTISGKIVGVFCFCWRNAAASTETFTEKKLGRKCTLHFTFYLSTALSKILPHSKTVKNTKKNDPGCLSNFLQTRIFWNFDHASRTYNQINYRNTEIFDLQK